MYLNIVKTKFTRQVILKLLFSFLFSLFNVLLYMMQNNQLNSRVDYCIMLLNVLVCTFIVYKIIVFIIPKLSNSFISNETSSRQISSMKYYWIVFLLHMLCWIPIFLAYYPGIVAYDIITQINQYSKGYYDQHPLLHTLYLHLFYFKIGEMIDNYTLGIALSTFCQMIFFGLSLSFAHLFAYKIKLTKFYRCLMVGLTSLLPIFPAMAISSTKDIFFTSFVIIYVTLLGYNCCFTDDFNKKRWLFLFVISSCGVILFRNNGIYAVIVCSLFIVVNNYRKKRYKICNIALLGIIAGVLVSNLLFYGLHSRKGSVNEALSLPYQQIAGTYLEHKTEIDDKYSKYVNLLIPSLTSYRSSLSDPIKRNGKIINNKFIFIKTYFKLLINYPYSYLKSFSLLNAGYLSLSDTTHATIYGFGQGHGLFQTRCLSLDDTVFHYSYIPIIKKIYNILFNDNKFSNLLFLDKLFSPALYFWITMFLFLVVLCKQLNEVMPIVIFIAVLLLTILAGPCCLIRYALPYISCFPILFSCIIYHLHHQNKA